MNPPTPPPQSGSLLSRYRLGEKLGQGGMGVVYRAFDTRLERSVAVKLLPPEAVGDAERRERFVREAKAASALNHAHIVTVYDIDRVPTENGEVDLIAMELVEGETLDQRLERGALPIDQALELALQLTDALAVAHKAGIVHRDVKPGNLMLTAGGSLKLLDFGLSRYAPSGAVDPAAPTVAHGLTTTGALVGTPAYMSPEQAEGKSVDARADIFAAGAVLYEMLSGRRPFAGDTQMGQLLAVMRDQPPALRSLREEIPLELERIAARCLAKRPEERYPSAVDLEEALAALRSARSAAQGARPQLLRRPAVAVPIAAAIAALLATAGWLGWGGRERSRARERIAEVEQLVERHDLVAAYLLASELRSRLPEDRELERLLISITLPHTIHTEPPGAAISFRGYFGDPQVWHSLGSSPIDRRRLPVRALLFRAEKPGFEPAEGTPFADIDDDALSFLFQLVPEGKAPPGMVRIPAGRGGYRTDQLELDGFWIGRHEVTNRDYLRFVEAGGYRDRALWRTPFTDGERTLTVDEALARFVDATGRPGPASWKFGAIPEGGEEHPVTGLSWFEADAYARWAGAELPTLHHWFLAAQQDAYAEILELSNFGGEGTVPVGSVQALGPYGTHDMAGNAFEWASTGDGRGNRFIAGGAWNEPSYTYSEPGAVSPFDRSANRGLRLARYDAPLGAEASGPVIKREIDRNQWQPVDDATFALYRSLFTRATGPLAATVDKIDEVSPHYRWERVSFDAGHDGERMPAHLLLPRNARPPHQAVVYFPPSPAERLSSSQNLDTLPWFEFLVRGGRAVIFPIYDNTYERRIPGWTRTPDSRRDLVLHWSREIGRAIDYLESRPEIDAGKIAYYGYSMGAVWGPVLSAVEPRIRVNLLLGGGVTASEYRPEVYPVNFAPRVTVPTILLTGRDDFVRPIATNQALLLELLGTPADQKKIAAFDGGHIPSDMMSVAGEALGWLDRWLGPVEPAQR